MLLNEDGSINFTNFNLLNESEQVAAMSTWNQEQIMSYYMQNSISEDECFTPVLELINDLEKIERNGSKVFIENGEVKTILNEDIQKTGYMSVEEMGNILHAYVNNLEKRYKR